MLDVAVDDPSDWPLEFVELKRIDSLLRCSICFEFFKIAMIVPSCSHNYCSFCIRKHITHKECCPICNLPLVGGDLKCNRTLDELVTNFKLIRERLIELIKQYLKYGLQQATLDKKSSKEKNISDDEFEVLPSFRCPNTTLNKSRRMESNKHCGGGSNQAEMTSCPVCSKNLPIERINQHLDECLQEQDSIVRQKGTHIPSASSQVGQSSKTKGGESKSSSVESIMKPLPTSCLNALQDKELKSKAKHYGLSLQGDRKQLIKRIEQYILLYNSQCDALNPMSASMVAKQVCKNEQNLLKHGYTPGVLIHTHDHRYSDQEKEDFKTKYGQEHEKHYQQLIEEIKIKQLKTNPLRNIDEFPEKVDEIADHELVIEIDDNTPPPDEKPEEITDHTAFGHVPDWFDADLLKSSSIDKKLLDKSKTTNGNITGKSKKSSTKNKKKNIRSGNIVSYFTQTSCADKKEDSDICIEIDLTTQEQGCSSVIDTNEVDSKCSVKLPSKQNSYICLVEDSDDDTDDDEIMPCTSRKSPLIYETEYHDEIMPESPSILQTEDSPESVMLKPELQPNAADAFNSTAEIKRTNIEALSIDTDLSPVRFIETGSKRNSRSKRAGSYSIESRLNCLSAKKSRLPASPVQEVIGDDFDNSLDSHCSELSVDISDLVDRDIENPHAFSSDPENEFPSGKLTSVPMNILQKNAIMKETPEKNNYSNPENVIPLPPSDLNFSEADF